MGDNMINHGKLLEDLSIDIDNEVVDIKTQGVPFKVITDAIDQKDLLKQTTDYTTLLHLEVDTLSSQLRHRAEMMRRRADEFDDMADSLIDAYNQHSSKSNHIVTTCEDIKETLQEHAHIEPTKVK